MVIVFGKSHRVKLPDLDKIDQEPETDAVGRKVGRRAALRIVGMIVAGATISAVGGSALLGSLANKSATSTSSVGSQGYSSSSASATDTSNSYLTVKVVYFGMSRQTIGTREEFLDLRNPAFLKDALYSLTQKHTSLIPMLGAMQIVIDGNPAEPDQQLMNGDEIDFIPVSPGG
jgi:molybdopterin converting factor small subunit